MSLFHARTSAGFRRPQPPRAFVNGAGGGGRCPQPTCKHPSHHGLPVPSKYCGTSQHQGITLHHVRCAINPAHHVVFARMGQGWQRVRV